MFRFGHMGFMPWGGGSFMMFFWLIILAFVIYFVVQKNRGNKYRDRRADYKPREQIDYKQKDKAEEIARERYAEGEISKEELNEILSNLRR
ncbi:MAG: SHOCT domain-containing protein [Halanaerobium sp.]